MAVSLRGAMGMSIGGIDDVLYNFGTLDPAGMQYGTTDANANHLKIGLPAGGAVDVPVLSIGLKAGVIGVDLAVGNGLTQPWVFVWDGLSTSALGIGASANATMQIRPFINGTTPTLNIGDYSGNEVMIFGRTASAVNEVTVTNAATGNGTSTGLPKIAATGGDTHIGLRIDTKGTSNLILAIGGTDKVTLDGSSLSPSTDAAVALGTTALGYNGLHLNTATAINWENGNVTLTHATGKLTLLAPLCLAGATAGAGTDVYVVNDNVGDLTLNALTGKTINFAINGSDEVDVSATALYPAADGGSTLGIRDTNEWAGLELNAAAAIAWGNADVTLTHAANALTFAGGDFFVATGNGVVIGHTAQITAGGGIAGELQYLGAGGVAATFDLRGAFSADAFGNNIAFVKSRHATVGSNTIVQDNDVLAILTGFAADGSDFVTAIARIQFEVDDAAPAASDIGGAIVFSVASGAGADDIAEAGRFAANKGLYLKGNLDFSTAALDIVMKAATAAALEISDGTTKFLAFDTRVATVGVTTIALDISDYTLASAANAVATGWSLAAHTLNYTGATQVTTQVDTMVVGARTLAGDTATLTIDEANTLLLVAPTEGANVALTAGSALRIINAGGTPTNQYGIYIEDLTSGATADYGIYIAGADTAAIYVASADPIHLGVAGASTGKMEIDGATSGTVTLTVAATAGTWTMTLPAAVGGAGEQLTDAAGNGICSWAAAASRRELKELHGLHDAKDALDKVLSTKVYDFNFREGKGTRDSLTNYVGPVADEAPWAMHYNGGIVNPINSLGYTVLAFQAMADEIKELRAEVAALKGGK